MCILSRLSIYVSILKLKKREQKIMPVQKGAIILNYSTFEKVFFVLNQKIPFWFKTLKNVIEQKSCVYNGAICKA